MDGDGTVEIDDLAQMKLVYLGLQVLE